MPSLPITSASAFALASALMLLSNGAALADHAPKPATEAAHSHDHDHAHDLAHEHDHAHDHAHDEASKKVSQGYFDDSAIQDRPLSDWSGAWQSVYPYLKDGTLQPVMAKKAEGGAKSEAEYQAYYETGYRTEVDAITIDGDTVTFTSGDTPLTAHYASDGYEVLTYEKGNRGVRFIFAKTSGDAAAPAFIQFSDHRIAPQKADHYHLYWGDDRAALLKEMTNWPTYYPAAMNGAQIVEEMLAH